MDVHVYVMLSVLGCFVNCTELFCPCRDFTARQIVSQVYLQVIFCVCGAFFNFYLHYICWGFEDLFERWFVLPRVWVFCLGGCCVLFGGEGIFALKFAAQIRTLHIVSRMMCLRFSVCSCCRAYNCTTDVVQVSMLPWFLWLHLVCVLTGWALIMIQPVCDCVLTEDLVETLAQFISWRIIQLSQHVLTLASASVCLCGVFEMRVTSYFYYAKGVFLSTRNG